MVFVNQIFSGNFGFFFFGTQVNMNFRRWTTGTGGSHFPKVIFFITGQDALFGNMFFPVIISIVIFFQTFIRSTFKNGYIQIFGIDFVNFGQQFPCPSNGFFLKIVSKTPVAQHFKHGVMVGIQTYFFQIVVLTGYTQTLLCIGNTFILWFFVSQKIFFKLIHSRIGKHQSRVVFQNNRCR